MNDNNLIYDFINDDISSYMKTFKIFTTENFNKKKIKSATKLTLGIKIQNNLLNHLLIQKHYFLY